ncbi:hypothetical protein CAEBREN_00992 [Caenorhabditis brenneri]|uniref:Uncharacterized protein n=1 Tax=Caenorhabditis brenneri TaxID=135651 RepID=G0NIT4_CAEBE|nr:hypothetical protein CAEBREN_00992 [Caenorhabditis brenneri]
MLPTFHSEELATSGSYIKVYENDEEIRYKFIVCLQICHGVRLQLNQLNHGSILTNADSLKMFNVISYCDWFLVHMQSWEAYMFEKRLAIFFQNSRAGKMTKKFNSRAEKIPISEKNLN